MNDKLVFGQYYHANSVIHKLNPKTKIIFTLLIIVFILLKVKQIRLFYKKTARITFQALIIIKAKEEALRLWKNILIKILKMS